MRKLIGTGLVAATLVLSGCGSTPEEDYYTVLQEKSIMQPGEEDIYAELGRNICEAFMYDFEPQEVMEVLVTSGYTSYQAGVVMTQAVKAYCPNEQDKINQYIEG